MITVPAVNIPRPAAPSLIDKQIRQLELQLRAYHMKKFAEAENKRAEVNRLTK